MFTVCWLILIFFALLILFAYLSNKYYELGWEKKRKLHKTKNIYVYKIFSYEGKWRVLLNNDYLAKKLLGELTKSIKQVGANISHNWEFCRQLWPINRHSIWPFKAVLELWPTATQIWKQDQTWIALNPVTWHWLACCRCNLPAKSAWLQAVLFLWENWQLTKVRHFKL